MGKEPASSEYRSRGYLPHCDRPGAVQLVTYRLADSLPRDALQRIELELTSKNVEDRDRARRERLDAWLDAGQGACLLREPAVADMVVENWRHYHNIR